ncbi:ABC transporter permease, partial [Actinophytocola sp.]|uniref:ABC transporter permease n=1 Tax=Actinophytocola sp. TaxID=1872138 RepID=UPI003D6A445D
PPSARQSWAPLPRRRAPRPPRQLIAIRTPISRRARWILMTLSFLVPAVTWWVLTETEVALPRYLPSPGAVLAAGIEMVSSGDLFEDLWASSERVLYGFGLALLVSLPLGILIGTYRAGQALFEPLIALLRYLPAPAFIPLFVIWLGLDEEPKIALVFVGTVFFSTLMTADVARNVPRKLIDVSYTLGATQGEVLRKVIVPHALPGMIDATRVNVAGAWMLLVIAEVVNSTDGLGRSIMQSQRFSRIDEMFVVFVVFGLIGVTTDVLLRLLRTWVGRWAA